MRETPVMGVSAEDLACEVVVTAEGGSQLRLPRNDSEISFGVVRRRWGSGLVRYGHEDEDEADPWALPSFQDQQDTMNNTNWSDHTGLEKIKRVLSGLGKLFVLLFLLYTFACSLDLLSSSFRLLGGRKAGAVFRDSKILRNPVVGLMIGVLATATLQSSSTSTSVCVTMVGSKLLTVRDAVPIVMGANIGTSVTNTLVSLGQSAERNVFRRAFAAATIHDMFNWLAVIVLLPLEVVTGYLEWLTGKIVEGTKRDNRHYRATYEERPSADGGHVVTQEPEEMSLEVVRINNVQQRVHPSLQTLTKPFTSLIVQLDKKLIEDFASGKINDTSKSFMKSCHRNDSIGNHYCGYLLERFGLSDELSGCVLMVATMVLLVLCLGLLVKLLRSVMKGHVAFVARRLINSEPRFPYNLFAGYAAMALGCAITVLVQSSSVFTSALTPLAGIGLVSLERIYPLTLGANLGTTTTSVLAAFAAPSDALSDTLRVALCHLFFNVSGILLFYPFPFTRLPIPLAKFLGSTVVKYRWFAFVYLFGMFFLLPGGVFALSLLGSVAFAAIIIPLMCLLVLVALINLIQRKRPSMLPFVLRDWTFLPLWARSLEPLDRLISRIPCSKCCPGSGERRDGRALGNALPTHSRMNILEPSSASGSAMSLSSAAGAQTPECYQAVKGFEECAFATAMHPRQFQYSNNNFYENDFESEEKLHKGTTTSDML